MIALYANVDNWIRKTNGRTRHLPLPRSTPLQRYPRFEVPRPILRKVATLTLIYRQKKDASQTKEELLPPQASEW